MEYIDLKKLPEDHPLRDALLVEIRAEFKHINGHEFRPVEPGRPMADYTYNTLSTDWTNFIQWRAPNLALNPKAAWPFPEKRS